MFTDFSSYLYQHVILVMKLKYFAHTIIYYNKFSTFLSINI